MPASRGWASVTVSAPAVGVTFSAFASAGTFQPATSTAPGSARDTASGHG